MNTCLRWYRFNLMRVKELFNLRHILKETVLSAQRYMTVGIDNAIFVNVFQD